MIELTKKQHETILACKTNKTGIISNTCGTGKTIIEINVIINAFNSAFNSGALICALGSHRLALNSQLTEVWRNEIISVTKNENNKIRIIEISSNSDSNADKVINIKDDILAEINYAKRNNEKLLIIFCYASISKLVNALENKENEKKIDVCIFDEAHIGQMNEKYDGDINNKLALCKHSKRYYGFTATPNNKLINNEFGLKIIQTYSYNDALSDSMVLPFRFFGSLFSNENEVIDSKIKLGRSRLGTTIAAFEHLSKEFEFPSLLVCGTSLEENNKINKFLIENFNKEIKNNELDIFLFSSEKITKDGTITSMLNGEKIKVKECFSKIKESNKKKIIIHCNMLSEGIDIPNINGVLIFGEKSKASLYQSIMRGCRIDNDDRILLKSIKNNDKISQDARIKKSHFNVYTSFEEKDSANQMQIFIKNLKYYGINVDEDFLIDRFDGSSIEENSKINFNEDFSSRFKTAISMVIKEDKENSIKIENNNIIENFKNQFYIIKSQADRVIYFKEMSDKYKELSFEFSKNFDLKFNTEFKMNGLSNPLYQKSKEIIGDITNTTILVINDFFTALCLSLSHKVIYLTNDEECSKYFNKYVNDEKFGNNDEAIYVYENTKNGWFKIIQELNMKFDYIIGNPPYDGNLHLEIQMKIYEYLNNTGKMIFIHPIRWYKDFMAILGYKNEKTSDFIKIKNSSLSKHYSKIINIDPKKNNIIFNNTVIPFDLAIDIIDKSKESDYFLDNLNTTTLNIFKKILKYVNNHHCNFDKNQKDGWRVRIGGICGGRSGGSNGHMRKNPVEKIWNNLQYFHNGLKNNKPWYTFYRKNQYSKMTDEITASQKFNSEIEAINFIDSYQNTNFMKWWTNNIIIDVNIYDKYLPFMEDYTDKWTDERFFNFFKLTDEEKNKIMEPYL